MPVEVMSELAEDADELAAGVDDALDDVVVGVVVEPVLEMFELISLYVLSQVANLSAAGTQT